MAHGFTIERNLRAALAVFILAGVTGCIPESYREDTVTLGIGDSVAVNKAIHTIEPWPLEARKTHQETDGERLATAIERYHENAGANKIKTQPITSSTNAAP